MMITLFAVEVVTEDAAGRRNLTYYDTIYVAAKDRDTAQAEVHRVRGKTYSELGGSSNESFHYRVIETITYGPAPNEPKTINVYLPDSFINSLTQAVEGKAVQRIMQYIDQLREPREV